MSTARITKSLQLQEIKNIDVIVDYEIPGVIRSFYFSRYTENKRYLRLGWTECAMIIEQT